MAKEWYEEVTTEEIEAIKAAMVSGSQGIATHPGHWYNCKNGHPVSEINGFLLLVYANIWLVRNW
jgi:hypothetical protein